MIFFLSDNLLDSATAMQLWLSSKTLQNNVVFRRRISKINDNSFISAIKGYLPRISWINKIYSDSVVLKYIYVCNLMHHTTGNTA